MFKLEYVITMVRAFRCFEKLGLITHRVLTCPMSSIDTGYLECSALVSAAWSEKMWSLIREPACNQRQNNDSAETSSRVRHEDNETSKTKIIIKQ